MAERECGKGSEKDLTEGYCLKDVAMKKVFDQTVRDLKREVNKKVLKIPGIEQKILDATNNEPWGPHGTILADIAQATRNFHEYQKIMVVIWKRINDTGKNWRHVYKALSVLEYLAAHGSERVIDEIREHSHQISTLSDFQYMDSSGKDQGSNVRRKSQSLVVLVNDKDRIQEARQKAHSNREKYRNIFTTGGMHQPAGGYGDDEHYDGRFGNRDDNQNGYGKERDNRDIDRFGRGDLNNWGGDQYSTGSDERGDRDGYRDNEDKGNRGNDRSHFDSRGRRIDGDRVHSFIEGHQHSPRQLECKYSDKSLGAPPSYEEVIGEHQNHVQDERERVQSPPPKEPSSPLSNVSSPENVNHDETQPESGAVLSQIDKQVDAFDEFDPRGSAPAAAPAGTSYEADIFGLSLLDPIGSSDLVPVAADATSVPDIPSNLDPGTNFGTTPSAPNVVNQIADDPFGDSPFMAISQDNNFLGQQQNLSPGTSFQLQTGSMGDLGVPQPVGQEMQSIVSFDFGHSFYAATPNAMNHQVLPMTSEVLPPVLAAPLQDTVAPESIVSHNPFETGTLTTTELTHTNILSQPAPSASQAYAVSYPSQTQTGFSTPIHPHASPYSLPPWGSAAPPPISQSFPLNHPCQQGQSVPVATHANFPDVHSESGFPVSISSQIVPSSMPSQPGLSSSLAALTVSSTGLSQSGLSAFGVSQPAAPVTTGSKAKPMQQKFETKSTVWADTLSRGLVDLNISGSKTNPLADIGVDFDSINRMEKRKEKEKSSAPPVSTINMGKAMGSGSGMGLVGATGLAPPPNPMMGSGMGMNMGNGGMNIGMGMGGVYGGGMNQQMGMGGAGMGMNMGQGALMQPPNGMGMPTGPAMPGFGYNPMMGMGGPRGYGPQQHQYGGYR